MARRAPRVSLVLRKRGPIRRPPRAPVSWAADPSPSSPARGPCSSTRTHGPMIRGLAYGFPSPGAQDSWNPRAFVCRIGKVSSRPVPRARSRTSASTTAVSPVARNSRSTMSNDSHGRLIAKKSPFHACVPAPGAAAVRQSIGLMQYDIRREEGGKQIERGFTRASRRRVLRLGRIHAGHGKPWTQPE